MGNEFESLSPLPPEVLEHYASGYESERLLHGSSQIELARTQELVMRYVPPPLAILAIRNLLCLLLANCDKSY